MIAGARAGCSPDPADYGGAQVVEQDKGRDALAFQGLFNTGEHSFSYTIPNLLIDHAMRNPHVPPGFWRGVNINQNAVFLECFMDELAHAAGQDALAFRRNNVPRAIAPNPVVKATRFPVAPDGRIVVKDRIVNIVI